MRPQEIQKRRETLGAQILAWLFREPTQVRAAEDYLHAGDFTVPMGFVFDAMCELEKDGREISVDSLVQLLDEKGDLVLVGGEQALIDIFNTDFDFEEVAHHVQALADLG